MKASLYAFQKLSQNSINLINYDVNKVSQELHYDKYYNTDSKSSTK